MKRLGYGELLMVGRDDLFGGEVNIASKLGDDVAGRGEICLSEAAHARIASTLPGDRFETIEIPVSGLTLRAHKLRDES